MRRVARGTACHDGGVSEQSNRGARGARGTRVIGNEQSRDEVAIVRPGSEPVTHERPEEWGWHGETGRKGRIGGWIMVSVILSYFVGNHEGRVEDLWLGGIALVLVVILVWDIVRRRNAWRG
ncbi:DUF2631 domain-containing protein [Modestobacter sp. I12A-02628]|uniref:DUF2631 domain-containing protein n=1 Tax=Goekera deserti TaxID=2497753 RepID=A0A7K3WH80_9ACTN|nr:DUF2631 domain-containing protein [Goekera deserti]NDI50246.1 DUF2631 domain-containing protein [Goekera deserti]NEL55814.1 DUF2631 domain-containing protein [Goekera deserti]